MAAARGVKNLLFLIFFPYFFNSVQYFVFVIISLIFIDTVITRRIIDVFRKITHRNDYNNNKNTT